MSNEERLRLSLEVLKRVANGESDISDAAFLASELGLTKQFNQENGNANR